MTARVTIRTLVVVALALLVQSTVMLDIRVAGVSPDVMVVLPVAAGLVAGPVEGAAVGFVAGIAADLLLPTPFGLSALVGTLVGFSVGALTGEAVRYVRGFATLVALVASAASVMLYAVLGAVLGEAQFLRVDLGAVIVVVSVANALLAGPSVRVARWALVPPSEHVQAAGRR